jgi:hypothetical protein
LTQPEAFSLFRDSHSTSSRQNQEVRNPKTTAAHVARVSINLNQKQMRFVVLDMKILSHMDFYDDTNQ